TGYRAECRFRIAEQPRRTSPVPEGPDRYRLLQRECGGFLPPIDREIVCRHCAYLRQAESTPSPHSLTEQTPVLSRCLLRRHDSSTWIPDDRAISQSERDRCPIGTPAVASFDQDRPRQSQSGQAAQV